MLLKRLLPFVLLLISVTTHAQDTLVLRTGKVIQAKVMEIRPTDIVYKKFQYQDGPSVTIKKNEVHMIKYPDGSADTLDIVQEETVAPAGVNTQVATLFFYRPSKMFSSARPSDIYVNDSFVCKVYNGKIVKVELPAGRYVIVSQIDEKKDSEEVQVENGKQYYYKCLVKSSLFRDEPNILVMSLKEGTEETGKMETIYNVYHKQETEQPKPAKPHQDRKKK